MRLVTMKRLQGALDDVRRELDRLGMWSIEISKIDVCLVPFHFALGYKRNGTAGEICIPCISVGRIAYAAFGQGSYYSLRDTLRHEYGHAFADKYYRLTRNRRFREAFAGAYDNDRVAYSERPCEAFADLFADYVRRQGRHPAQVDEGLRRQWAFLARFAVAVRTKVSQV